MVLAPLLLCLPAWALEPGFYNADDVAVISEVFARSSATAALRFDEVQRRLADAGTVLALLDVDVALCGAHAPESYRSYAGDLRKRTNGQFLQAQAFVDVLTRDFQTTFEAALQRAVADMGGAYEIQVCKAPRIVGMPGSGSCRGTDLNPAIGGKMDKDPLLKKNVDEILAIPWPELSFQGAAQPVIPVTGQDRYVDLDALASAFLSSSVTRARENLKKNLEPLEADMEESEDPATKARATEQAKTFRSAYDAEMAALGDTLFAALSTALPRVARASGPDQVGVCANPIRLSGCVGEDVTPQVLPLLETDRKFVKGLPKN